MFAIIKDNAILYLMEEKPSAVDMEYDKAIKYTCQNPVLVNGAIIEDPFLKHKRISDAIINGTTSDLEGEYFSDIEIGDIITARVFGGNPYAQIVLQAKVTKAMMKGIAGTSTEADLAIVEYGDMVTAKINEVRNLFGLSNM